MWPRIDKNHSHCFKCNRGFRNVELTNGYCTECIVTETAENKKILARSENKAVASAATQFLASIKEQGKSGASMPRVFESFWREIGGEDAFGDMMAKEFKKAHGEGLTEEESEIFQPSQKMRLQWYELISRHAAKTDEGKTLDVGSLDESDLESILSSLAHKALLEDEATRMAAVLTLVQSPQSRREVFLACLEAEPDLATELLAVNGIETIDAVSVSLPKRKKQKAEYKTVREEVYDPTQEEFEANGSK